MLEYSVHIYICIIIDNDGVILTVTSVILRRFKFELIVIFVLKINANKLY